jgi:homoserine kinase
MQPLELLRLPLGAAAADLWFVLVNPKFEAPTSEMRAVLPKEVSFKSMINNCCMGGALVRGGPAARSPCRAPSPACEQLRAF